MIFFWGVTQRSRWRGNAGLDDGTPLAFFKGAADQSIKN